MPERSLQKLLENERRKMLAQWSLASNSVDHDVSRGELNETTLRKVLRQQLPIKYGVGSGFVEVANGDQSTQQDVIVYDAWNSTPLYEGDDWGLYPVEIVWATVEVKTTLNIERLREALEASQELRRMASRPQRILREVQITEGRAGWERLEVTGNIAPRTFIFAYDAPGYATADTLTRTVTTVSQEFPEAHVHGLCVLNKDWFVKRLPLGRDVYEFETHGEQGWPRFLQEFQLAIATLARPTNFANHDIVDRRAYLEPTPDERANETAER